MQADQPGTSFWSIATAVNVVDMDAAARNAAAPLEVVQGMRSDNLTPVVLPSSNAVLCSTAVLASCSSVLHAEEHRLGTEAVQLDFSPAQEFPDDMIVDFLSRLHRAAIEHVDAFPEEEWVPEWCILITALGMPELFSQGQQVMNNAIARQEHFWNWMRVRLHSLHGDQTAFRNECLRLLADLPEAEFGQVFDPQFKDLILAIFADDELFSLAYVRLTGDYNAAADEPTASSTRAGSKRRKRAQTKAAVDNTTTPKFTLGRAITAFRFGGSAEAKGPATTSPATTCIFTLPDVSDEPFEHRPAKEHSRTITSTTPRELTVDRAKDFPDYLKLRLEVNPFLTVICDADFMPMISRYISQAFIESEAREKLELPLVTTSSMNDNEVLEFFEMLHSDSQLKRTKPDQWKYSWVQLASFLQISHLDDKFAKWVWSQDHTRLGGQFWAWISATRLHSMQRLRPKEKRSTTTNQDVLELLRDLPVDSLVEQVVDEQAAFRRYLGMSSLIELLSQPWPQC